MKKTSLFEDIGPVSAEFRFCLEGHVRQGCSRGWTMHPFPVIIWNCKGFGKTLYRSSGLNALPRPEGSVAYILANETRQSVTESPDGLDFITAGFAFEYHGGASFLNRFHVQSPLPEETQAPLRRILAELAASERGGTPLYRQQVIRSKAGYEILDSLLNCAVPRQGNDDNEWRRLYPAIQFLNQNYRKRFDIDALLQKTKLSRVHFYRVFREQFRIPPQEYMIRLRVREAVRLLLETDLSVGEIGFEVGWDDPYYFSKIFKQNIGTSPLNYRQNPGGIN